jgi:hypothetical protein
MGASGMGASGNGKSLCPFFTLGFFVTALAIVQIGSIFKLSGGDILRDSTPIGRTTL